MVRSMSANAPTQSCESECPECGLQSKLNIDPDGWLACSTCGLQIEAIDIFESSHSKGDFDSNISSGNGHGGPTGIGRKLSGSFISGTTDHTGNSVGKSWKHRGRFRAKLDNQIRGVLEGTRARKETMRMIREATRDSPTLQREALYNFSKGWPEPQSQPADFKTIAHAGHPTPRASSAAACILVAGERMGIRIPAHQLITQFFDSGKTSQKEAKKYLTRSIKCLRSHIGHAARKEATNNRLDSVLNAALARENRLGKIFNEVRSFCLFWAEYTGQSRVLDAPASYAACAAYVIGKSNTIGLTLEDIQKAFEVSPGFRVRVSEVQDLYSFTVKHPGVLA